MPSPFPWLLLLPMNVGDTIVFSSSAWHRSSPNSQPSFTRISYIQTWVHPDACWQPEVVPWHPVNEHLHKAGYHPSDKLAGERHPTVSFSKDIPVKGITKSKYLWKDCVVNTATKKSCNQISMFDASDVISTQFYNILVLRNGVVFDTSESHSLVAILHSTSH